MLNIITFSAIRLELSNLRVAPSHVTKISLRTPKPPYIHIATWRLQWDYFGNTHSVCKSSFLWKWLHFSIVVKNVAQHLWTQCRLMWFCLVFCFAVCFSATVLYDLLRAKFLAWWGQVWNCTSRYLHKICSCTQIVGKYSVHHMPQIRTYCKKICTQLTRGGGGVQDLMS